MWAATLERFEGATCRRSGVHAGCSSPRNRCRARAEGESPAERLQRVRRRTLLRAPRGAPAATQGPNSRRLRVGRLGSRSGSGRAAWLVPSATRASEVPGARRARVWVCALGYVCARQLVQSGQARQLDSNMKLSVTKNGRASSEKKIRRRSHRSRPPPRGGEVGTSRRTAVKHRARPTPHPTRREDPG